MNLRIPTATLAKLALAVVSFALLARLAPLLLMLFLALIAALPLVASYPVIERVWLRGLLVREETVDKHVAEDRKSA